MRKVNQKAIVMALIVIILLGMSWPVKWALVITNDDHQTVYTRPFDDGLEFEYMSIHSVSLTTLLEYIRIEERDGAYVFVADKVRYEDQSGAGLPEYAYEDSVFYEEDGYFFIEGMDRVFKDLSFQVEEQYNNTLFIDQVSYRLYDWVDDRKGSVSFEIKKISLIDLIRTQF